MHEVSVLVNFLVQRIARLSACWTDRESDDKYLVLHVDLTILENMCVYIYII